MVGPMLLRHWKEWEESWHMISQIPIMSHLLIMQIRETQPHIREIMVRKPLCIYHPRIIQKIEVILLWLMK